MSAFLFVKCFAQAAVENGLKGFANLVPGGDFLYECAGKAWSKYRDSLKDAEQRAEIERMAQATFEEAKAAAIEVVRELAADAPSHERQALEQYLTQIPAAVKQSLKRPDDPTGTTVPATFTLNSPDDLLKMLPPRAPRFHPGDELPNRPGLYLSEQIGMGGFGELWLIKHRTLRSFRRAGKFGRDRSADRDLVNEREVIDRLMAHDRPMQVVPLLDADFDGNVPWLMYEYIDGGDLTALIREWEGLPPAERVMKALAALHEISHVTAVLHSKSHAVVHRDLKPSNFLRDSRSGRLWLTDLGISGISARAELAAESGAGGTRFSRLQSYLRGSCTLLYASPQQQAGADPDPRDDVYSLGVIGYQMLTGELSAGAGPDFADDLRDVGTPDDVIALLSRCVARKLDRRPRDAAEVAQALERYGPNPPATVPAPKAEPPKPVPAPKVEPPKPQAHPAEERDWTALQAKKLTKGKKGGTNDTRTIADYQEFLARWPRGFYAEQARTDLNLMHDWRDWYADGAAACSAVLLVLGLLGLFTSLMIFMPYSQGKATVEVVTPGVSNVVAKVTIPGEIQFIMFLFPMMMLLLGTLAMIFSVNASEDAYKSSRKAP